MPVKTIMTYVDGNAGDASRLGEAVSAARRFDAHLTVAAIGYVPDIVLDPYPGIAAPAYAAEMEARSAEEARDLARATSENLTDQGIRADASPLVTTPSQFGRTFGELAMFTDLVVLQWFTAGDGGARPREAFEGALFNGEGMVLLSPEDSDLRPKRALIAWDGSATALHAVRRAYPVLRDVPEVEICLVEPSTWQFQSAEALAIMLSRYGLTTSIYRAVSEGASEAETILRRQIETGAGLTVLGGYGHSRFREMVLGGVTRQLPAISATPLLMAH